MLSKPTHFASADSPVCDIEPSTTHRGGRNGDHGSDGSDGGVAGCERRERNDQRNHANGQQNQTGSIGAVLHRLACVLTGGTRVVNRVF
jgi:hypothetical protein